MDKNLIYRIEGPDGEPRFRMLETIGEFAQEALAASGEEAVIREAHAWHIVRLVEEIEPRLQGREQVQWIARLAVEQDNVRAALRWLLDRKEYDEIARMLRSQHIFWWMQGQTAEARRWAEEALTLGADIPQSVRMNAYQVLMWADVEQRDDQAMAHIEQAHALARAEGDLRTEGYSLLMEGFLRPLHGDSPGGIALMWDGQRILREAGDEWGVGLSLTGLSALSISLGQLEDAQRFAEEHVALARRMGDMRSIAHALDHLAMAALLRGDSDRATSMFAESLTLAWKVGQLEIVSYSMQGLAMIEAPERPQRAARLFGAAAAFREAAGVAIWPPRLRLYDQALNKVREALGEETFEAAHAEGRAMRRALAVEYALHGDAELPLAIAADSPSALQ